MDKNRDSNIEDYVDLRNLKKFPKLVIKDDKFALEGSSAIENSKEVKVKLSELENNQKQLQKQIKKMEISLRKCKCEQLSKLFNSKIVNLDI